MWIFEWKNKKNWWHGHFNFELTDSFEDDLWGQFLSICFHCKGNGKTLLVCTARCDLHSPVPCKLERSSCWLLKPHWCLVHVDDMAERVSQRLRALTTNRWKVTILSSMSAGKRWARVVSVRLITKYFRDILSLTTWHNGVSKLGVRLITKSKCSVSKLVKWTN